MKVKHVKSDGEVLFDDVLTDAAVICSIVSFRRIINELADIIEDLQDSAFKRAAECELRQLKQHGTEALLQSAGY